MGKLFFLLPLFTMKVNVLTFIQLGKKKKLICNTQVSAFNRKILRAM